MCDKYASGRAFQQSLVFVCGVARSRGRGTLACHTHWGLVVPGLDNERENAPARQPPAPREASVRGRRYVLVRSADGQPYRKQLHSDVDLESLDAPKDGRSVVVGHSSQAKLVALGRQASP
jgi:hypothetical protein